MSVCIAVTVALARANDDLYADLMRTQPNLPFQAAEVSHRSWVYFRVSGLFELTTTDLKLKDGYFSKVWWIFSVIVVYKIILIQASVRVPLRHQFLSLIFQHGTKPTMQLSSPNESCLSFHCEVFQDLPG